MNWPVFCVGGWVVFVVAFIVYWARLHQGGSDES